MVTDSLVRKSSFTIPCRSGIVKIYATQESVVRSNYQLRSKAYHAAFKTFF